MKQHSDANATAIRIDDLDTPIWAAATEAWQDVLRLGEKNGFRNAQASVIAPTGTIGLAMSCDTTGLEPDLALVKFKKLVGGGSMQIVNGTVPQALRPARLSAGADRGGRRPYRRARQCDRRARSEDRALRGVRLRDG